MLRLFASRLGCSPWPLGWLLGMGGKGGVGSLRLESRPACHGKGRGGEGLPLIADVSWLLLGVGQRGGKGGDIMTVRP